MEARQPVLLVMAAGMGSRYGGLKQIDPLGPGSEILMDYSVYDAMRAGFQEVIFVIRRDFHAPFEAMIKDKIKGRMVCHFAFQDLDDLPPGHRPHPDREKPWGTGHAVLAARQLVKGPVAVINADDYYGPQAYQAIYNFLIEPDPEGLPRLGLCTWPLMGTLSEYGQVSRGLCRLEGDRLVRIEEIQRIEKGEKGARYSQDGGLTYLDLDGKLPVSMNFWGFPGAFMDYLARHFQDFLEKEASLDPLGSEYLLPRVVDRALEEGLFSGLAMPVSDTWYGVTNRADRPRVVAALKDLTDRGLYPSPLWADTISK